MPTWLQNILDAVAAVPAAGKSDTFNQLISNERNHGLGLTAPEAIDAALVEYADQIKAALGSGGATGGTGATGATAATGSTGGTGATGTASSRST